MNFRIQQEKIPVGCVPHTRPQYGGSADRETPSWQRPSGKNMGPKWHYTPQVNRQTEVKTLPYPQNWFTGGKNRKNSIADFISFAKISIIIIISIASLRLSTIIVMIWSSLRNQSQLTSLKASTDGLRVQCHYHCSPINSFMLHRPSARRNTDSTVECHTDGYWLWTLQEFFVSHTLSRNWRNWANLNLLFHTLWDFTE